MDDMGTCPKKLPVLDSDTVFEIISVAPGIKISSTEVLRDDAMIGDYESETNDDEQINSRQNSAVKIISDIEISGISSLLNIGDLSNNEEVSISDLNLINPMRLEQEAEDTPELINKVRKNRNRACRNLNLNKKVDSEADNQDFSPSDGSEFDPDSASRFSDDSVNVVSLSDIKNHPDNKVFIKKSDSTMDESLEPASNNQMLEENESFKSLIIQERYEAENNSEESCSDLDNERPVQPDVTDQKKKRKWVRQNACIFCEKLVTNFTRHLLNHHKDESEVLQYTSINDPDRKIRKQKRRKITDDLRNKGNFLHNSKAIFEKEGNLILKKGKYTSSSPSSFTTCKKCLGTFKRKYFYKHFKSCGSELLNMEEVPESYKKRMLENHSISIIPHLSAASQELKDHILPRLRNDEISTLVKTDPLILAYGSRLMKKKKEARSRKAICSKLRDLGNLLLHLKNEDPSIQELSSLFKPQKYTTFMNCVKKMCGFNEETGFVETISIPSRLRPSVLGCIEVLYTEMIMGHGSQAYKENLKKQLDDFKLLIQINWEWEISSNAEKTRKRNLMTKETVMPLDKDIQTITEKIHELEKNYSKKLKIDTTVLNYENLCEVTIAHIIVMDKKRAGDVAEAELSFYLNRKKEETPARVLELLSKEQKEAIDQLDVFMIPGKRTRSVPVLLTKQMRRNIDLIVASRQSVGVSVNNPLLFARPLTSRPFDGGKCLNKIKNQCKLNNPKMLTSTGIRHHIATISQLYAKTNDQYTEHLAGFLGHDLTVHSSNYRLPLQVIQKGVIGSSLMEFEKRKKKETVTSKSMLLDLEKGSHESDNEKLETTRSQLVELDKEETDRETQNKRETATSEPMQMDLEKGSDESDNEKLETTRSQLVELDKEETDRETQNKRETATSEPMQMDLEKGSDKSDNEKLETTRSQLVELDKEEIDRETQNKRETVTSEPMQIDLEQGSDESDNEKLETTRSQLVEVDKEETDRETQNKRKTATSEPMQMDLEKGSDESDNEKLETTRSQLVELDKEETNRETQNKKEIVTSESMQMDLEKETTTTSQSVEVDIEKSLDSGAHTDRQLKETRRGKQENKLINQKKTRKAINVIDITLKGICQSQSEKFLLEDKGTVSMLANDQDEEKTEKNRNLEKIEKRILRNVKGRYQSNPHKRKIQKHKQTTCPSQNTESNRDEENQIGKIAKLNRLKCRKSSSESSDTKEIKREIKALKHCKPSKKRKAQNLSEDSLSSSDESQNVIQTRRRKKTHTFWTKEELKAVRTYFKDNIKNKTNPGKAKCLEVLRKVPELSRRTWMQLNTQVNNIYKKK